MAGTLRELAEGLEGEALVEALAGFEYTEADEAAAAKGTSEWYNAAEDRALGDADSVGELQALVADGTIDLEVYRDVLERLAAPDDDTGATVTDTEEVDAEES
jgi:hypothetical protein